MLAGIGKTIVTPKIGAELVGYGKRADVSQGIHDDLYARAIVLDDGVTSLALCSVEMLFLRSTDIVRIRQEVVKQCDLLHENIFIATTHTHSGPAAYNTDDWDGAFYSLVAKAIIQAYQNREPAKIGIGSGFLIGYNINRRWLDRPTDPHVGVIRIDADNGQPLAVFSNYACHAVVLGHNNLLISGDWPGYASRILEDHFGNGMIAIFTQGGAGDVNPLTETVRQRLESGYPVGTIGEITTYYGDWQADSLNGWNIEDRSTGSFDECETLARAYIQEILRVWKQVDLSDSVPLWIANVIVDGSLADDEPPAEGTPSVFRPLMEGMEAGRIDMEIVLVGIGNSVLVSHPGESFSETSIAFRKYCQQIGYQHAFLVTYANGNYAYLPPENAYAEGGYEVLWPRSLGVSRFVQDRIQTAIEPILSRHLTRR